MKKLTTVLIASLLIASCCGCVPSLRTASMGLTISNYFIKQAKIKEAQEKMKELDEALSTAKAN